MEPEEQLVSEPVDVGMRTGPVVWVCPWLCRCGLSWSWMLGMCMAE